MSRFIDALDRLSRVEAQPLGFRTKQPASSKPRIQLVASLAQGNAGSLVDRVADADAGLLRIADASSAVETLKRVSQAVSDVPWGGWLQDGSVEEVEHMVKAGCDFLVFPAAGTPLAIADNTIGKIVEVESSLAEGLLRAVNELPIDGVFVAGERGGDYSLTWQHLMLFKRFADVLTKPLLVTIPSGLAPSELQALWEAGVDGVVVEITAEQPRDALGRLRQLVDNLTFPQPRKREKAEPLLPHLAPEPSAPPEEEEEEE